MEQALGTVKSQSLEGQCYQQSHLNSLGWIRDVLFSDLYQYNLKTTLRRQSNVRCKNLSKGFKSQLEMAPDGQVWSNVSHKIVNVKDDNQRLK